jgi:hypothetical protein
MSNAGLHKFQFPGHPKFSTVGHKFWVLDVELALCYPSVIYSFEVATRFLENFWTTAIMNHILQFILIRPVVVKF